MDEWQVGDPADWGDSVGVPDIPYMGYLNDEDGGDEPPRDNYGGKSRDKVLADEAWALYMDCRSSEAIVLINRAVELNPRHHNHWNIMGIILEDLRRYGESKRCYDESLRLRPGNDVVVANKARMMRDWAKAEENNYRALEIITEAMSLLPSIRQEMDVGSFWRVKGEIYERMGDETEAHRCFLAAANLDDKIRIMDEQIAYLKNTDDTLICITGTQFFHNSHLISAGSVVDLIGDPTNEHDVDAIRVEFAGNIIGYVANSPYTMTDGVKSATSIRDSLKPDQKAEIKFWHLDKYLIAKLI